MSSPFDNQFDASNDEAMTIGGKYTLLRSLTPDHLGDRALAEEKSGHKRVLLRSWPLSNSNSDLVAWLKSSVEAHQQIGNHPNIINLLDSITENNQFYLVYPEVSGELFSEWLDYNASSQLDNAWEEGLEYILQCMDALNRIHAQSFYHGDLSPATMLISRDDIGAPVTKLPNVGLYAASNKSLSDEESTLPYRAPEQLMSENNVRCTNAVDIYAVGVMLHALFTGNAPETSHAGNITGTGNAFENFRTTGNKALDDQLKRVIQRALAFQPEDRFSSVRTMADTLRSALTEHSSQNVMSDRQPADSHQKLRDNQSPKGAQTPGTFNTGSSHLKSPNGDENMLEDDPASKNATDNNTIILVALILIPIVMISMIVLAGLALFQPWNYFSQTSSPSDISAEQPGDTGWYEGDDYLFDDDMIPDFDSLSPEERERLLPPTPVEHIAPPEDEIPSAVPVETSAPTPEPTLQPASPAPVATPAPETAPAPVEVPPVPQEVEPTAPIDDPAPFIELTPISPPLDTWESDTTTPTQTIPRDRVPERTVAPEGSLTPAAPPVETPVPSTNNFGWGDDEPSDDWEVILEESRRKD